MKTVLLLLSVLIMPQWLVGCGYHTPAAIPQYTSDKSITLYMGMWTNRTNEIGLESLIRIALTDWLVQSNIFRLTASTDKASYKLNGTVVSVDYPGASYDAFDRANVLKAVVTSSFSLVNTETGKAVVEENKFIRDTTYLVGSDAVTTQSNKKSALNTIVDEIAEEIYIRTFYALTGSKL